jgi:hypothetical protein
MDHTLSTNPTERTLQYWSSLDSLSAETQRAVGQASIVIVPQDGFRDHTGPVFPTGTVELFRLLRERSPQSTPVEIAIDEPEYKELTLHYDLVTLAGVVVEYVVAPVVAGLLVEYLKVRLGDRFSKSDVEASITVDESDGVNHRAWEIKYKGPAPTFETTVQNAIATLPRPEPKQAEKPAKRELPSEN